MCRSIDVEKQPEELQQESSDILGPSPALLLDYISFAFSPLEIARTASQYRCLACNYTRHRYHGRFICLKYLPICYWVQDQFCPRDSRSISISARPIISVAFLI